MVGWSGRSILTKKRAPQQAPVLRLLDFASKYIVTTDASGFCMDGVRSQLTNGADYSIAVFSKSLVYIKNGGRHTSKHYLRSIQLSQNGAINSMADRLISISTTRRAIGCFTLQKARQKWRKCWTFSPSLLLRCITSKLLPKSSPTDWPVWELSV